MKFTANSIITILLILILGLVVFNVTIEGLINYSANDVDVIYHVDETRDYNKLLSDVMADVDVATAFSDTPSFIEIKDKIIKDPTVLVDLKSRLASYIDQYKDNIVMRNKLDQLIAKLDAAVEKSDFIIDKEQINEKTVKDFRQLFDVVKNDAGIKAIFADNHPLLDKIYLKLQNNPEMLENAAVRLKSDIDSLNKKTLTDDLMSKIAVVVKNTPYIKQLNMSDKLGGVTYNEPGYFRFGSSNYVPNYEDSVYLSRLTDIDWKTPVVDLASQVSNSGAQLSGLCAYNKSNPGQTELECNKLDKSVCASTSCCVLLGGAKCMSGNENGPSMKSNFSDIYIRNKDHYYYQGKCYGNCP